MKTFIKYVIADEQSIYAEATTRQKARDHLYNIKNILGKKAAKIFKEEYALIQIDQVR